MLMHHYVREMQLHAEVLVGQVRGVYGAKLKHMLHIQFFVGRPIMGVHIVGRIFHSGRADGEVESLLLVHLAQH